MTLSLVAHDMSAGVLEVDSGRLSGFMAKQGWQENQLPVHYGSPRFVTGNVAPGISITKSECSLKQDFRSCVDHDAPVAILGFGLRGHSNFSFGRRSPSSLVRPGDIWLYRPDDQAMCRHTPAGQECQMVALKFSGPRFAAVFEEINDSRLQPVTSDGHALRLTANLDMPNVLRDLLGNPLVTGLDRLAAESAALTLLVECLQKTPTPDLGTSNALSPEEKRAIAQTRDLLIKDLSCPPDLETLARATGFTHTRLNRCFRKAYGTTVFAWLRDYRLEQARILLGRDHQSITDIAYFCGFSSSSHFGSCFRARFGQTPQQFRQCPDM
ncbi:AraC family transcriptional regulator [Thalassospira sp. TSL5-1]|uniref:AraC family transcriptional regulator n=1 Tax=Thalassospira sp. TSL5-1 TaxID=1544451 RepID=UPI00093EC57B|nr:AraC family transcriptional regulator [Thalassospira sp. TSL5-1]